MENEVEKKSELHIVKSESPCPNADAPLNKSERKKLEDLTKKLMAMSNEAAKAEAAQKEKLRVDFTNLKFSLVKLVIDTKTYPDKSAEELIVEIDKLANYIHK
jgi:hypothetical protein